MLFGGLRTVIFPDGGLLAVRIPLVLTAQLPTEQTRLMLPLVRRATQHQRVLLPDTAPGKIEPGIVECLSENQSLGVSVEYIDAGIPLHVLFHIDKHGKEEFIEIFIRHIVVFDFASGFFYIHVVRWVGQNQVGSLTVHQLGVGFRQSRVATDQAVSAQEPHIPSLGHRGLLQFRIHIEVILLDVLVMDFGEKLLDFWSLKASEVRIEIGGLQINDEVSQKLFIPSTRDFIKGDVQSLDLVLILNMDFHTLHFRVAQVFQNRQSLVTADNGHVVVDDDRLYISKLQNGVLDFLIFFIPSLQLFAGVIRCRTECIHRQGFPLHCTHEFSSSLAAGPMYGSRPSSSQKNLSRT